MTAVCRDYGISNVGLAKVCKRHNIPCPPRGYWATKQSGKATRRTPLPACADPALQTVEFHTQPPKPAEPAVPFDADIVALLNKARSLPAIAVPDVLRDPHPMVQAAQIRLEADTPDVHNLVSTPWYGDRLVAVAVGRESVPRALRVLNALLKASERIGGRIEVRPDGGLGRHETVANFCGEAAPFRLRERYRQVEKPPGDRKSRVWGKYDYPLTGEFVLDRGRGYLDHAYGQDTTADGRVEDQINEILVSLVTEAGHRRNKRREREAEKKCWEVQEHLRWEQAEREKAERARVEKLLAEADAWRRADSLRGFIGAVERLAVARNVNGGEGTELAAWLAWARRQADQLDPVTATLDRLTRPRPDSEEHGAQSRSGGDQNKAAILGT